MTLEIETRLLRQIHAHAEAAYPEEGAGFLLGSDGDPRRAAVILTLPNAREDSARRTRYLITPGDYLKAEAEAHRLGLSLIGVFHSHPDHPDRPSEYDRQWAQPFFSYVITGVQNGRASETHSWRLSEDRTNFVEETIRVADH